MPAGMFVQTPLRSSITCSRPVKLVMSQMRGWIVAMSDSFADRRETRVRGSRTYVEYAYVRVFGKCGIEIAEDHT